ncbi:hypothetical protein LSUE1_G009311, partial [Lachnellula suecica]
MASYQSGFDPPTRPGESGRSKRMGTYMQGGPAGIERREADNAQSYAQMETRRGQSPLPRTQQTALPRPSARGQPSSSTAGPETRSKGFGGQFGFGKSIDKPVTGSRAPELKGKSSRNVLRRKPSSIAQQGGASRRPTIERSATSSPTKISRTPDGGRRPSIEASFKSAEAYNEIFTRPARTLATKETPRIIPELDRYRTRPEQAVASKIRSNAEVPHKLATQDLPPPTPLMSGTPLYSGGSSHRYSGYSGSGYSASPSTRFSESPGPGAYSRDTTPTSMSSQSPGIIAPLKTNPQRLRQGSPALTRPPITRRRAGSTPNEVEEPQLDAQGLPALRESITSSSSNSTVKNDTKEKEKEKKKKKKRLSPLPPSPPPRKSSQKFKKTPSDQEESPSKPSRAPAKPVMMSPSESSPILRNASAQSGTKNTPPLRPSRDGAPDLRSQLGDSMAVIQSNLAGINFSPDRRQSILRSTATSPLQTQPVVRPSMGSRQPSRNPSPSPMQPSRREATPAPAGLGIIPDLRPQQVPVPSRGTATRTPSPSLPNSKPRFGLFGRRTKTTPDVSAVDNKDKSVRKGPAAGTGHEGYGRYGARGRSSSAGALGMTPRDRSLSQASSQESAHDPFLRERMSPVIIAGGGEIIENRNASSELSRTESNTSLLLGRPSLESRGSSKSSLSHEVSRTTLWPSALPKEPAKRSSIIAIPKGRRPSDSSEEGLYNSSLAFRRSLQRRNNSATALNLPRPLNIPNRGISPSMSSLDASIMSDESQLETKIELSRGRKELLKKPKKLEKRPKSPRKWNFFHRQPTPKPQPETAVAVAVGKPPAKTVPHYAMLDSSDEQQDPDVVDLEDILRDANAVNLSDEELDILQFGNYKANIARIENLHSMTPEPASTAQSEPIPSAPIFSSPEPMQITPVLQKTEMHLGREAAPARPSRLPQVGRIPKVVSARPQATSPKSFSRPFARLSTIQPLFGPATFDKQSVALGPSPPKSSTPEPPTGAQNVDVGQDANARQSSGDTKSDASTAASNRDFLVFPPRKTSEATTSSSGHSYAGTTAIIPEAHAELEEDEVWDEYDDLIENDDTLRGPVSATSSHGMPFQYESYENRQMRKSKMKAKESPTLASAPAARGPLPDLPVEVNSRRSNLTSSSAYSADMSSRMKDAFAIVPSPTTPMSFTDFFSGYGDRNNSVHTESAHRPRRTSQSSSRKSTSSSSHSRSRSGMRPISEQESSSPISQVNLRVGSMTVSKWLTFGHVLFSPAREEIMQSKRHSVLVIDGLGNDDWSFYAAETYPSSTFYNLSATRPLSASKRNSTSTSFPLTPPNHRQIQYTSPHNKFPFPSSTFHVVVFRFPSGMSEAAYRNIIAESKRVLKPGGYLEMAILDLDMMNMGNRARRAVRGMKVKMQVADPGMSLAPASDTVLRIVGKRGFGDLKTCNVGVPVASTISSSSSNKPREKNEEMSLADMMKDDSHAGDEGITKMVAKVGRWWYTRCYEMGVLPDGDVSKSIFNDGQLLAECEKWNSSFKLVVAYAQKPV